MSGYSGVAPVLTSLTRGQIKRRMKGALASKTSAMTLPAIILLAFIDSSDRFGGDSGRVKVTIHGARKTVNSLPRPISFCYTQDYFPYPQRRFRCFDSAFPAMIDTVTTVERNDLILTGPDGGSNIGSGRSYGYLRLRLDHKV